MAGIPFSQEEQKDWVGIPVGVRSTSCSWAQKPGQGHSTKVQPWLSAGWHMGQRSKATEPGHPITSRACFPSPLVSGCRAHYLQPQGLVLQNHFSLWAKGALCDWSWGEIAGGPHKVRSHHHKAHWVPPGHLPASPDIIAILTAASGYRRQHWDFKNLEPTAFPLQSWSSRTWATRSQKRKPPTQGTLP